MKGCVIWLLLVIVKAVPSMFRQALKRLSSRQTSAAVAPPKECPYMPTSARFRWPFSSLSSLLSFVSWSRVKRASATQTAPIALRSLLVCASLVPAGSFSERIPASFISATRPLAKTVAGTLIGMVDHGHDITMTGDIFHRAAIFHRRSTNAW